MNSPYPICDAVSYIRRPVGCDLRYHLRFIKIYYMVSIMVNDTKQDIKALRLNGLPLEMRLSLKEARKKRGWTQRDLVSRIGLTQRHVSGIESGKIVPRYDNQEGEPFGRGRPPQRRRLAGVGLFDRPVGR